jgi:hypothetical protein
MNDCKGCEVNKQCFIRSLGFIEECPCRECIVKITCSCVCISWICIYNKAQIMSENKNIQVKDEVCGAEL